LPFTTDEAAALLEFVPGELQGQERFVRILFDGPVRALKAILAEIANDHPDWHGVRDGPFLTVYIPVQLVPADMVKAYERLEAITAVFPKVVEIGFEIALADTLELALEAEELFQDKSKPGATFAWLCADGLWGHGLFVAGSKRHGAWIDLARRRTETPDGLDWGQIERADLVFGTPRPTYLRVGDVIRTGQTPVKRFVAGQTFSYRSGVGWDPDHAQEMAARLGITGPIAEEDYYVRLKECVERGIAFATEAWIGVHHVMTDTGRIKSVQWDEDPDLHMLANLPSYGSIYRLPELEAALLGFNDHRVALMERAFPVFLPH
jgi:hypothetical protein